MRMHTQKLRVGVCSSPVSLLEVCTTLGRKEEEESTTKLKVKTKLGINAGGEANLVGHNGFVLPMTCSFSMASFSHMS